MVDKRNPTTLEHLKVKQIKLVIFISIELAFTEQLCKL